MSFGATVLETAADVETSGRAVRVTQAEDGINETLDHIWRRYLGRPQRPEPVVVELDV